MSYQVFPENPMIFPDNRDSVTKQLRALVAKWRDPSFLPANDFAASFALNCADDLAGVIDAPWHDPQALARGPQQAGGEDAKDAARYRWIRQHFKATFHRSTSDYWLIQGEHKTPAAVFRDGMDLTLDAAIDAALNGGQDDA